MPHQVLFIQGGGKGTHDEWDNKLVESLRRELGAGYQIRYPHMPDEAEPNYASWSTAVQKELSGLNDGAILVGHSIGGTILLSSLADVPPALALRGILLVAAPFVGEGGWRSDDIQPMADLGEELPARTPVYIYHGSKDETAPLAHAGLYAKAIPRAVVRQLAGRNHQLDDDMSEVAADIRRLTSAA
jgi:predicted alpha/beta hydrolase family esterase